MKIKICCTANAEEALLARAAGATAIGLVGEMPSGPGVIGVEAAATIVGALPSDIDTFFLTSKTRADDIETELVRCGANTVQVVQHIDPREHERLQATLPQVRRVQVVHVEDESALSLIERYGQVVDALLLDSGRTAGAKPQFGGTGSVHDWSISRQFVESTDLPVYLAGGLSSKNIFDAIAAVRPAGVDVCSGVRTDGALDPEKLQLFIAEINRAAEAL